MRSKAVVFSLLVIYALIFIPPAYSQESRNDKIKHIPDIRDAQTRSLEEEIIVINLLNNLDLTRDQLEFIIRQAREIEGTRSQVYAEFSRYSSQMRAIGRKIKRQVEAKRVYPDKELVDACIQKIRRSNVLFFRLNGRIKEGIAAVEERLKDFQLVALDKYIPCIIPIVTDTFIGGVDGAMYLVPIFASARMIPAARYADEKYGYIAAKIEELQDNMPTCKKLYPDDIVREEISRAIDSVRQMDDVEFKLKVNSLAEELNRKIVLDEPELSRQERIQKYLLSRKSIPVLEKRLKNK
ncbi:MAG: hypothetical protein PHH68_03355 [Candidatus Omnitrophica bacterium]|nr:hypothetical protein [Candidatus Omnitrophota bacterium]